MQASHPKIYDSIGRGYRSNRVPDHRIAAAIRAALGDVSSVCNVGAGAGSYEPRDLKGTAVEPSEQMIRQRSPDVPVVQAVAENLPFEDQAFDASMACLTIHHWLDVEAGLIEMKRIAPRQVIFTFDPDAIYSFWLVRDYLPEIIELDRNRSVPMSVILRVLDVRQVLPVMIPRDCTDGFLAAYWARPEKYLDPEVRHSISTFAQLPEAAVAKGLEDLANDLQSGKWYEKYACLTGQNEMDFGYRLVIAGK